jgi:hypothetical protein
VKIRDGPAAVSGDEGFKRPLSIGTQFKLNSKIGGKAKANRMIHKSEDLPDTFDVFPADKGISIRSYGKKRDTPGSLTKLVRGFFYGSGSVD